MGFSEDPEIKPPRGIAIPFGGLFFSFSLVFVPQKIIGTGVLISKKRRVKNV
jgi:hypothetical protein